jgi:hypothetical protein
MRIILGSIAALGVLAVVVAAATARPPHATGPRTVVVAELFTSEGCSSCPPADAVLREWVESQPVDGVEIVGLGEHVDYWDRLGWRDPFSSAAFSARQSAYDDAVFHSGQIYTPQVVVDGQFESIGSDQQALRQALQKAARQPKAAVSIAAAPAANDRLDVRVRVNVPATVARRGAADVVVAVIEDGLATKVARGENGGRTLRHAAVTRSLSIAGSVDASQSEMSFDVTVPIAPEWSSAQVKVVAFLQERDSRRILGGASMHPVRHSEPGD